MMFLLAINIVIIIIIIIKYFIRAKKYWNK